MQMVGHVLMNSLLKYANTSILMQVCTAAAMWVLGPPSTSLQTTAYLATATWVLPNLGWDQLVVLFTASLNGQDVRPTI